MGTSLLIGRHKISYAVRPRAGSVIWKKLESEPPTDLGEPPREGQMDLTLVAAIFGNLFYPMDMVLPNTVLKSSLKLVSART